MKKILSLLLCFVFLAAAGCSVTGGGTDDADDSGTDGGAGDSGGTTVTLADNSGMEDSMYDLKTYLYPVWEGTTVYNETLWFAAGNTAPLLYTPDEVLSVKSYDLGTTYTENVDYVVDGDEIVRTDSSDIPYMTEAQYYPSSPPSSASVARDDGTYWYIVEGDDISKRQVTVTYTHSNTVDWTLPRDDSAKLSKTVEKLESGETLKVVFYGDSITVGANSSEYLCIEPYAESYANMVKSYLAARYPGATIDFVNNAVGGTDSNWGNGVSSGVDAIDSLYESEGDHFQVRVLDEDPDLLFIAFGMNDQESSPYVSYRSNIASMIEKVRAQNPDVEIVLVASMIANPETAYYNKDYEAYQDALIELGETYDNVAVSTTYNTVMSVYDAGVRFQDCTANNANHPNDFMMRLYAQTLLYTMFGEDYIDYI